MINTSIVTDKPTRDDIEVLEIPANEIAESVNADRSPNMVVCAAMCKKYALADTEHVFRQIPVVCEGKEKFIRQMKGRSGSALSCSDRGKTR